MTDSLNGQSNTVLISIVIICHFVCQTYVCLSHTKLPFLVNSQHCGKKVFLWSRQANERVLFVVFQTPATNLENASAGSDAVVNRINN